MIMRTWFLTLSLLAFGCGATNRNAGPNYSTTPCAENCGNDPQCQASCTPVRNPNVPLSYPSQGK
jgi:hypothetical protein